MSLNVNYFAGPGAGKSTTAAATFVELKKLGMNVELVTEYAKDATWEERWGALACQPHVFGEQLFRMERLAEKVDIIVTDSPILLSAIYNKKYPVSFNRAVADIFRGQDNLNYFINRTKPYVKHGRSQNLAQAKEVDTEVKDLLISEGIPFTEISGSYQEMTKTVLSEIFQRMGVDFSES